MEWATFLYTFPLFLLINFLIIINWFYKMGERRSDTMKENQTYRPNRSIDLESYSERCYRAISFGAEGIVYYRGCFILGTAWLLDCRAHIGAEPRNVLKRAT